MTIFLQCPGYEKEEEFGYGEINGINWELKK